MMGTEIFNFDASLAEKLTKTRVSFLAAPTVCLNMWHVMTWHMTCWPQVLPSGWQGSVQQVPRQEAPHGCAWQKGGLLPTLVYLVGLVGSSFEKKVMASTSNVIGIKLLISILFKYTTCFEKDFPSNNKTNKNSYYQHCISDTILNCSMSHSIPMHCVHYLLWHLTHRLITVINSWR